MSCPKLTPQHKMLNRWNLCQKRHAANQLVKCEMHKSLLGGHWTPDFYGRVPKLGCHESMAQAKHKPGLLTHSLSDTGYPGYNPNKHF